MSSDLEFPSDFPGGCPPNDAGDAKGIVYRQVRSDPPTDSDFLSIYEEGRRKISQTKLCQARGVSVLQTEEDAVKQCRMFRMRGEFIATGTLTPAHGRLKPTHGQLPSHATWWCYEGIDRKEPFTDVRGVDDVAG
jgi:hypothetical protein